MRLRISRKSDVSIREQITSQIVLAITSNELQPEEQLPSTRSLARRLKIHANTVSAAYRDLVTRGWLEHRRGSGVYVRNLEDRQAAAESGVQLDMLLRDFLLAARANGFSTRRVRARMQHWLEQKPAERLLVIEDDEELRRILVHEVSTWTGVEVQGVSVNECRDNDLPERAVPVALYGRSEELKELLPPERECTWLRTRSVQSELQRALQPLPPGMSVAVVSHWPDFLRWARTILFAAGVDQDAVSFHDAREKRWKTSLKATDVVVVDALTDTRLPSDAAYVRRFVFSLLSDAAREELGKAMQNFTE